MKNAVGQAAAATQRLGRSESEPPAPEREIESWLGELRGEGKPGGPPIPSGPAPSGPAPSGPAPSGPSDSAETTAIPAQPDVDPALSAEETRAIPVTRPEKGDSDVATEKLNARGKKEGAENEGTGNQGTGNQGTEDKPVSAQDLLRREGRI